MHCCAFPPAHYQLPAVLSTAAAKTRTQIQQDSLCNALCVPQVTDIRLITDRHTKRSKGLAYVEFSKQEEVFVALALTGMMQQKQ
jgi:RNA recognition motif-containing protein